MVAVPQAQIGNVAPAAAPNAQIQPAENPLRMEQALDQGGKELRDLGNAGVSFNDTLTNIQTNAQDTVNQTRVQDAVNQARGAALNLTYDPQNGYQSLKGAAALDRPSGQPLSAEYGQKLTDGIGQISANLGNNAQRQAFAEQAGKIQNQFQEGIQQHTLSEFKNYNESVQKGAIELNTNQAVLAWNNPSVINSNIDQVKQATYNLAQAKGLSPNETQAAIQTQESAIHSKVIETALDNQNPGYAMSYFNQNKGNFTADDILKFQSKLTNQFDSNVAQGAVSSTQADMMPRFAPTNMDRLTNIVSGIESNHQDFNPDGSMVTSTKGALGRMQVMPATADNPGFGITPAKDHSPAELARVGTQYLDAMVKKYQTPDKVLAAYNAGPGALDDALAQAAKNGQPNNWLSLLPAETQAYVQKGTQQFNSGMSAPPPTKLDFVQAAVDKLGPQPDAQQVEKTQLAAGRQYELVQTSLKQKGNDAVTQTQQALLANGGDYNSVPQSVLAPVMQFAPDKIPQLQRFASSIANPVTVTDAAAKTFAYTQTDQLAKMPDADFTHWLQMNVAPGDQTAIVKARAKEIAGQGDDSTESINGKFLDSYTNNRLTSLGLNSKANVAGDPNTAANVANIKAFMITDLLDQQKAAGQKYTPAQIQQRVDQVFATELAPAQTGHFPFDADAQPLISKDFSNPRISDADRARATTVLTAAGRPVTEDNIRYIVREGKISGR